MPKKIIPKNIIPFSIDSILIASPSITNIFKNIKKIIITINNQHQHKAQNQQHHQYK